MADILIRNVSPRTKERLRLRAKRRGKSLEADLRETLEQIAIEDQGGSRARQGFGTWLARISRPGVDDLSDILDELRSAPLRRVDFE
jgi:hypothetical protein